MNIVNHITKNNNKKIHMTLSEWQFVAIETVPHNEIKDSDATIILKDVPKIKT